VVPGTGTIQQSDFTWTGPHGVVTGTGTTQQNDYTWAGLLGCGSWNREHSAK